MVCRTEGDKSAGATVTAATVAADGSIVIARDLSFIGGDVEVCRIHDTSFKISAGLSSIPCD
jgi:hypothetical protein